MEWRPHQYLDVEEAHIQYALHGVLFRIDDGAALTALCAKVRGGEAILRLGMQPSGGLEAD
jgi:hypothetical protein